MSPPTRLLLVNPNSSRSITAALRTALEPHTPPACELDFFNPSNGPRGIHDAVTAEESTNACLSEIVGKDAKVDISGYDGVLVCCFSEHPLIDRLSDHFAERRQRILVLGMFHAGVANAILTRGPFGIIATGTGDKPNLVIAVANFLGSHPSSRFAGVLTSNLKITELQDGDQAKVEANMKTTAIELLRAGAETLVLGCAGMSGMEAWVYEAASQEGKIVRVVDGARSGVEMLVGLIRASR